jgi:hypothetical protein
MIIKNANAQKAQKGGSIYTYAWGAAQLAYSYASTAMTANPVACVITVAVVIIAYNGGITNTFGNIIGTSDKNTVNSNVVRDILDDGKAQRAERILDNKYQIETLNQHFKELNDLNAEITELTIQVESGKVDVDLINAETNGIIDIMNAEAEIDRDNANNEAYIKDHEVALNAKKQVWDTLIGAQKKKAALLETIREECKKENEGDVKGWAKCYKDVVEIITGIDDDGALEQIFITLAAGVVAREIGAILPPGLVGNPEIGLPVGGYPTLGAPVGGYPTLGAPGGGYPTLGAPGYGHLYIPGGRKSRNSKKKHRKYSKYNKRTNKKW